MAVGAYFALSVEYSIERFNRHNPKLVCRKRMEATVPPHTTYKKYADTDLMLPFQGGFAYRAQSYKIRTDNFTQRSLRLYKYLPRVYPPALRYNTQTAETRNRTGNDNPQRNRQMI